MKKNNYLSGLYLVQLTIGLYFFLTGLLGVMRYDSGANQFMNSINKMMGTNTTIPLIISISMLVVGLFLVGVIFFKGNKQVVYIIVFVLWIVYMIYTYFTDNMMKPDTLTWLQVMSKDIIILSGLWAILIKN